MISADEAQAYDGCWYHPICYKNAIRADKKTMKKF
jgi:hypothetical protein